MKWVLQENNQDKLNEMINKIDGKFILERIAYNLKTPIDKITDYIDEEYIKNFLATLLLNRKLEDKVDVLNNPYKYFTNPYELYNAVEAAYLIIKFLDDEKATIYIYADYDADGLTAGYVTYSALKEVAKCNIVLKYPNRCEGYGLSMDFCNNIVQEHNDDKDKVLVMTVDNGITKVEEIDFLIANGITALITDHHTSKEKVPNCLIVNPHNNTVNQGDKFKHLSGCGVAFKIVQIVQENYGINNMYNYIPFLAISTITDVMPLNNENLAIIQYGLDIMNSPKCPEGLLILKKLEEIDIFTTETIGWIIGPMLNACGRMGDTSLGSKLFFVGENIIEDVQEIIAINKKRKDRTKTAINNLNKEPITDNKVLIHISKAPAGILGIIAGKATETFNKPAIVVTNNNGILHGSARSINGINLIPIMQKLEDEGLLISFGGHSEAIGISFEEAKLEEINNMLNKIVVLPELKEDEKEEEILNIDQTINMNDLNIYLLALSTIFPMDGRIIKDSTFAITDLELISYKAYQSGYLELKVKQGKKTMTMSALGLAKYFEEEVLSNFNGSEKVFIHIAGNLKKHFKTKQYALNIVDIMMA